MTICLQIFSSLCPKQELHETSPVLGESFDLVSQLSSRGHAPCNRDSIQINRGYRGIMEKNMESTITGLGL